MSARPEGGETQPICSRCASPEPGRCNRSQCPRRPVSAAQPGELLPPGVPQGARLVSLAQLKDEVAGPGGSLRLGPRGSYLRMRMRIFPFGLYGTVGDVLGGVAAEGHRVFSLRYYPGVRQVGRWQRVVFTQPGAAERELWIWTLDDSRAEREQRRMAVSR